MVGGAAAALAAATGGMAFLRLARPTAPAGEEGYFESDCCGTVRLAGGRIELNDRQSVRYDVGRDERGPYLLPRTYVGALEDYGFEVDGTQSPSKLRLDRLPAPQAIELPMGTRSFVFRRKREPARRPRR
jgi:hypothetical protein